MCTNGTHPGQHYAMELANQADLAITGQYLEWIYEVFHLTILMKNYNNPSLLIGIVAMPDTLCLYFSTLNGGYHIRKAILFVYMAQK